VSGVLVAGDAVLCELKTIFQGLLVLLRAVVDALALGAFQFDEIILRHNVRKYWPKLTEKGPFCQLRRETL
jgi:hypothetical protein